MSIEILRRNNKTIYTLAKVRTREKELMEFIRSFKQHPCSDCGAQYHFAVMEFDHCRGKKTFALSQPGRRSKLAILEELKKCDLVCANCHRMRTTKRSKEAMDLMIRSPHKTRLEEAGLKMIADLEKQILEIRKVIERND